MRPATKGLASSCPRPPIGEAFRSSCLFNCLFRYFLFTFPCRNEDSTGCISIVRFKSFCHERGHAIYLAMEEQIKVIERVPHDGSFEEILPPPQYDLPILICLCTSWCNKPTALLEMREMRPIGVQPPSCSALGAALTSPCWLLLHCCWHVVIVQDAACLPDFERGLADQPSPVQLLRNAPLLLTPLASSYAALPQDLCAWLLIRPLLHLQVMEVQFFGAHTLYTKIRREWYCAHPHPIISPRLTPSGDAASCVLQGATDG